MLPSVGGTSTPSSQSLYGPYTEEESKDESSFKSFFSHYMVALRQINEIQFLGVVYCCNGVLCLVSIVSLDVRICTDSQSLDTKLKLMADIKLEMEALMAQIKTKIHSQTHKCFTERGKLEDIRLDLFLMKNQTEYKT